MLTLLSRSEKVDRPFSLDDVPTSGTLPSQPMTITDGRSSQGNLDVMGGNSHQLKVQFGGPNQADVVGYTLRSALHSVAYGERP